MNEQMTNPIPDDQAILLNNAVSLWLVNNSPATEMLPNYGLNERPKSLLHELTMGLDLTTGKVPFDFCGTRDHYSLAFLRNEGFIILDTEGWLLHPFIVATMNEEHQKYALEKFSSVRLKPFEKFGFFKQKNHFAVRMQEAGIVLPHENGNLGKDFIEAYWKDLAAPDELLCDAEQYTAEELAIDDDEDDEL